MQRLLSDLELRNLTEKYCVLDGSEIPILIKLLWDVRHFQADLLDLPIDTVQTLFQQACDLDNAIALQVLHRCNQESIPNITQDFKSPGTTVP